MRKKVTKFFVAIYWITFIPVWISVIPLAILMVGLIKDYQEDNLLRIILILFLFLIHFGSKKISRN